MSLKLFFKSIRGAVPLVRTLRRRGPPDPYRQYWKRRAHLVWYSEMLESAREADGTERFIVVRKGSAP